jgi:aryl-alcohol dehydrogenase-like predicted oxidoreductase
MPEYVRQACDASLRRLAIDHIDLSLSASSRCHCSHRGDSWSDVRSGASGKGALPRSSAKPARRLFDGRIPLIQSVLCKRNTRSGRAIRKMNFSRRRANLGSDLFPTARWEGAFLTGQFKKFEDLEANDYRRYSPRFQGENFARNLELVDRCQRNGTCERYHTRTARPRLGSRPG